MLYGNPSVLRMGIIHRDLAKFEQSDYSCSCQQPLQSLDVDQGLGPGVQIFLPRPGVTPRFYIIYWIGNVLDTLNIAVSYLLFLFAF